MEQHNDMAKGFVKGDQVHFEQLWAELASELNASGPPTKEGPGWKKVWTDMKLSVKQRLAHNKFEVGKTGGGRFNKYVVSPTDEQIAVICGLYASVDVGVEGAKSYGVPKKLLATTTSSQSSTSSKVLPKTIKVTQTAPHCSSSNVAQDEMPTDSLLESFPVETPATTSVTPTTSTPVSSRKRQKQVPDIQDVLEMEDEHFTKMSGSLEKIRAEIKESSTYLKDLNKNIRELRILKDKELKETMRHNYVVEKSMKTRNEIKLKFFELEEMKLGIKDQSKGSQ